MREEGYIKFNCQWIADEPPDQQFVQLLNPWRQQLYDAGLIGVYPNGIGFGNVSARMKSNTFIITGTSTGSIEHLCEQHYTQVTDYNIFNNSLTCQGPVKASSESLTHAIIYEVLPTVNAVVHVHNKAMWDKLIHDVPTTSVNVEYGTPEMALEIERLIRSGSLANDKILVMAGHEEGIITFGEDLEEAVNLVLKFHHG